MQILRQKFWAGAQDSAFQKPRGGMDATGLQTALCVKVALELS